MRYANAGTTEQHERAAAEAVDKADSNKSTDKVDSASDDDVEHHIADTVTGIAVDLLGIIEDHVYATPLLKHSEKYTDSEDAQNRRREQLISPEAMFGFGGEGGLDLGKRIISIRLVAYFDQRVARSLALSVLHQPTRAFRDRQRAEEKNKRGYRDGCEHPAPAELAIPGRLDLFRACSCRDRLCNEPIHNLGGKNSYYNRELVQRYQPSAPHGRAYFGDVSGRDI